MAGAELIGKEEIKEIHGRPGDGRPDARYAHDKERKGIFKVRDFEKAFAKYLGTKYALGSPRARRPSRWPSRPSMWDPGTR